MPAPFTASQHAAKVARKLYYVTQENCMWTLDDLKQEAAIALWKAEQRGKRINTGILGLRVIAELRKSNPGGSRNQFEVRFENYDAHEVLALAQVDTRGQLEAREFLQHLHGQLTELEKTVLDCWLVQELSTLAISKKLRRHRKTIRTALAQIKLKAESLSNGHAEIQARSE